MSPGDSGAWVVHIANSDLYGHVVATNALDQIYVVPVLDTFENMRACLGAISVGLPNAEGLMKASSPGILRGTRLKDHDTPEKRKVNTADNQSIQGAQTSAEEGF